MAKEKMASIDWTALSLPADERLERAIALTEATIRVPVTKDYIRDHGLAHLAKSTEPPDIPLISAAMLAEAARSARGRIRIMPHMAFNLENFSETVRRELGDETADTMTELLDCHWSRQPFAKQSSRMVNLAKAVADLEMTNEELLCGHDERELVWQAYAKSGLLEEFEGDVTDIPVRLQTVFDACRGSNPILDATFERLSRTYHGLQGAKKEIGKLDGRKPT